MPDTNVKLTAVISAESQGLIDALKRASGAINDTESTWKDRLKRMGEDVKTADSAMKALSATLSNVKPAEIGVEGLEALKSDLKSVEGILANAKSNIASTTQELLDMRNAASSLGMPFEEYQAFAQSVKQSGLDMQQATAMIEAMKQKIADFANGVPEAVDLFGRLGISVENVGSNTVMGNFTAIAQGISEIIPQAERATQNMQMFGQAMQDTISISQRYQNTISEQKGTFASDRDVVNAVNFADAINKLSQQIGVFSEGVNTASASNANLNQTFAQYITEAQQAGSVTSENTRLYDNFWDALGRIDALLKAITVTYKGYVDQLKSSASSQLDASQATKAYLGQIMGLQAEIDMLMRDDNPSEDAMLGYYDRLEKIVSFFTKQKETIKDEMDAVKAIMDQRTVAGAPIDMTTLDEATKHLDDFRSAIEYVLDSSEKLAKGGFGLPDSMVASVKELSTSLANSAEVFQVLHTTANSLNGLLDFSNVVKDLKEIDEEIAKLTQGKKKIEFDMSRIEALRKRLEQCRTITPVSREMVSKEIDAIEQRIDKFNARLAMTGNQGEALGSSIRRSKASADELEAQWRKVHDEIVKSANSANDLAGKTDKASASADTFGGSLAKSLMQMAGLGSLTAVWTKIFRTAGDALKYYLLEPMEKAAKQAAEFAHFNSQSQTTVSDRKIEQMKAVQDDLVRLYDLIQKADSNEANMADMEAVRELQRQMQSKYMGKGNPYSFNLHTLDEESNTPVKDRVKEDIKRTQEGMIKAEEAVIKSLNKEREALDETYDELRHYVYQIRDFNSKRQYDRDMQDIRDKQSKIDDEIAKRMHDLSVMSTQNPVYDIERKDIAKSYDDAEKRRQKAVEEQEKKDKELSDKLEKAQKALDEWIESLSLKGKSKDINEIMKKYADMVDAGVDEAVAFNTAEKAIRKVIMDEQLEYGKELDSLVGEFKRLTKAYQSAWEALRNANAKLREAREDEIKAKKDVAKATREEAIERKKEKIKRRMATFGFRPYEGFDLGENASERNKRRRNARTDASISEKMAQSQAGERVHFSKREKDRLEAYLKLQRQDKALSAEQKQMRAADKQIQAADKLQDAAKAVKDAVKGRDEARAKVVEANRERVKGRDKLEAQRGVARAKYEEPQDVLRRELKKRGRTTTVPEPPKPKEDTRPRTKTKSRKDIFILPWFKLYDYKDNLKMLHQDLQALATKTFRVV